MTLVVGVIGFKGSGKDTVGDYLVREHGFKRDSYASPLKDAVATIFGWERALLEGSTKESREWRETPDIWWETKLDWKNHAGRYLSDRFTPRVALQYFGTDLFRNGFHNDIWILSLENRLRNFDRVVVTDCRFPNEFNVIKNMNGMALRVKRDSEPEWFETGLAAAQGNQTCIEKMKIAGVHESEWAWLNLPFDSVIENDSTITELEAKVECLIQNRLL